MTAAGAGMLLAPSAFAQAPKKLKEIGVQLYTVRQAMGNDVAGTLQKVGKIGYTLVEGAGYQEGKFYGQSPADFRKMLDDAGLRMPSGHTMTGNTFLQAKRTMAGSEWEAAVADFKAVGQEYIVLAYLMEPERKNMDDYKKVADLLNKCGEVCRKYGIQMAYHNHDFEFTPIDGKLPIDTLLGETDAGLVKMELDIYWITRAGHDPIQFFDQHAGRIPLWHVKDIDNTEKKAFTEVGNGTIDWKKVFAGRKTSGMQYFFVEQDVSRDPLASLEQSYGYLKKLKV